MSDLRTRIAVTLHDSTDSLTMSDCNELADAVIRELQLTVLGDGIVVGAIVGADDVLKTSKRHWSGITPQEQQG